VAIKSPEPKQQGPAQTAQPPAHPQGLLGQDTAGPAAHGKQQRDLSTGCPAAFLQGCAFTLPEASIRG